MSQQIDDQTAQRPAKDDKEGWKAYWKAQSQPWRTEPEIDAERQKYLSERRSIIPDIEKGLYPFKDIKLSRADVEWLLATHENGRGPIDWSDKSQREREGLDVRGADLQKVNLSGLPLAGVIGGLTGSAWFYGSPEQCEMAAVHMQGAILIQTQLAGAKFNQASLERANFFRSNLEKAELRAASLQAAFLNETCLGGTLFRRAHLEGVWLTRSHLEGVSYPPADLRGVFFDSATNLSNLTLGNSMHGYVELADVMWGGANLSRIDWSNVKELGDEYKARQLKDEDGQEKSRNVKINEYETAVRANRQLAVALQGQGLNEEAARFAYRGQKLQRVVLRLQRKFGRYLFSLFLDLLTGYGYKPLRSFLAYLLVIIAFATTYFIVGHTVGPVLSPLGSFVFSLTSFHGRGFFPGGITLDDPLTVLAAFEAFIGLLIEVTFIATLTRRLFGG